MSLIKGEKIALQLIDPHRYRVLYAILLKDQSIGEIELDHIAWRSKEAELKVSIPESAFHNQGYGTDAITALLGHAFSKMGLKRVYLRVKAENHGALRCYEKVGFKKEGRLRRRIENKNQTIFLMGLSKGRFLPQTPQTPQNPQTAAEKKIV